MSCTSMSGRNFGLINFLGDVFFLSALKGVQAAAKDHQFNVVCFNAKPRSLNAGTSSLEEFSPVHEGNVDGLIFCMPTPAFIPHAQALAAKRFPVVLLGREAPGVFSLLPENAGGIEKAVRHLVQHGHTNFAFLAGPEENQAARQRLEGFKQALARHSLKFHPELVVQGDFSMEKSELRISELLDHPHRNFTAIVCSNDDMAAGAITAIQKKGFRVPDQFAVTGFDDRFYARWNSPPLASIPMPGYRLGYQSIEMLVRQISHPNEEPCSVHVPVSFVGRTSCGCHPKRIPAGNPNTTEGTRQTFHELAELFSEVEPVHPNISILKLTENLVSSSSDEESFLSNLANSVWEGIRLGCPLDLWRAVINIFRRDWNLLFPTGELQNAIHEIYPQALVTISDIEAENRTRLHQNDQHFWKYLISVREKLAPVTNETELMEELHKILHHVCPTFYALFLYEHQINLLPSRGICVDHSFPQDPDTKIQKPDATKWIDVSTLWQGNESRAMALFVLHAQQDTMGLLALDMNHPALELLPHFSGEIAFAIKGTRLLTDLRRNAQNLSLEIQERKRVEEALRQNEQHFRSLIENASDLITILDPEGIIGYLSPSCARLLGYEPHEMEGKSFYDWIHVDDQPKMRQVCYQILATNSSGLLMEFRFRHRDDSWKIIESVGTRFVNKSRNQGVLLNSRDITEKRKTEEDLQKARKLEALGTLAGGIAHDFNNLLSAILGNISLARLYVAKDNPASNILSQAENASDRAKELARQFLTFSKGGNPIRQTTSLTELVKESISFVLRGSNIQTEFKFPPDLWLVDIDVGQFNQVMQNLVINAREAMPDGGSIRILASNLEHRDPRSSMPLPHGKYVELQVQDEGSGIAPENLGRIFDPYFTSKENGSGLGLAITDSIIRKHGGYIRVESKINEGSSFIIYLPASEKTVSEKSASVDTPLIGKGSILILDDEEIVQEVAGEILKFLGFDVEFARTGHELLERFKESKKCGKEYTAMILDLTIPGGFGGKDVIKEIRAMDSNIKTIVSSGYSNDPVLSDYQSFGFDGVITKPYRVEDFRRVLNQVLGQALC